MFDWRPMRADDIRLVSGLAAKIHPGFFEEDIVFAERQSLAPEGCWICEGNEGALGYVLSHPWTLAAPPALNTRLGAIPEAADSFYIHDLALVPQARGIGASKQILEVLIGIAKPYPTMSLVAVNGSIPFWSRFGFEVAHRPDLAAKLISYDREACLMVRAHA
jgi:GNAT superfamily N-acetyltransferase